MKNNQEITPEKATFLNSSFSEYYQMVVEELKSCSYPEVPHEDWIMDDYNNGLTAEESADDIMWSDSEFEMP